MSAAVTPSSPPSLSSVIRGLLDLVGGHATGPGRAYLRVDARTCDGIGHEIVHLDLAADRRQIPPALLNLLEDGQWGLALGVVVTDVSGQALRAHVVTVARMFEREFRSGELHWPAEARRAVLSDLAGLTVPPTVVVDTQAELVAGWALTAAIGVEDLRLARRAAARLIGAPAPLDAEDVAALTLPLPGGRARTPPYEHEVDCRWLDLSRRYTLQQILGAGRSGQE